MKVKSGYVLKSVAGQYIVVPTGTEAINFNGYLILMKVENYCLKLYSKKRV
jgi:hypothetical protein